MLRSIHDEVIKFFAIPCSYPGVAVAVVCSLSVVAFKLLEYSYDDVDVL